MTANFFINLWHWLDIYILTSTKHFLETFNTNFFFFFFSDLTLSHSTSPIFVKGFFEIGSRELFAQSGFE
jgi:hypothetical protein